MGNIGASAPPRAKVIARLNDKLREEGGGGIVLVTRGVRAIDGFDPRQLAEALAAYEAFDADNDPHGERDFGDITLWSTDLLWKIDYYDADLLFGSEDPADAEVTTRVLTVMIASEW